MLDFEYLVKKSLDRIYYPDDYKNESNHTIEGLYLDLLTKKLNGSQISKEDFGVLVLKENNKDNLNQFIGFIEQINIDQLDRLSQSDANESVSEVLLEPSAEEVISTLDEDRSDSLAPIHTIEPPLDLQNDTHIIEPTKQKEINTSQSQYEVGSFLHWIKSKELKPNSMHETVYRVHEDSDTAEEHHLATKSVQRNDQIISESLAMIYANQGDIESAINMFEQLSLKKPEKKLYFAQKIDELKKNKQ